MRDTYTLKQTLQLVKCLQVMDTHINSEKVLVKEKKNLKPVLIRLLTLLSPKHYDFNPQIRLSFFLTSSFSRNAALSSGFIFAVFSRKSLIAEFASEEKWRD